MSYYFLDTSAVLNGALKKYSKNIILCPTVISELEHIKTTSNNEQLKYRAREAVRDITLNKTIIFTTRNGYFKLMRLKYKFLTQSNDHIILQNAWYAANHGYTHLQFITADYTQYLFAQRMKLNAIYFEETDNSNGEYCGWGKYYPNEQDMSILYTDPQMNVLRCKTNEFAEIYEGTELKDILFWNGKTYRPLKYKEMKNPYINEVLKPRNLEQKMAFDLMQNKDIPVKLLTSAWGSGKTLIALTYALEQVGRGNFQKLIFVRNNIVVDGTNDIGFLPGDIRDKMSIWGGPLADHLGGQTMLDTLIDEGVIEIFPLSHIRGRSIRNSIVICDECENMNDKLVTLLMSRIEEGSELIFCGDVAQIDHRKFEKNNGIRSMISNLSGEPLFGTVKLLKSERGPVGAMCDRMRPPI